MKRKLQNKKGFTLAELLIVVAIIAVMVAVAIPVFTAQLEKSREAVDAANIRAAYAEVMTAAISGETPKSSLGKVVLKQQTAGWQNSFDFPNNLIVPSAVKSVKPSANKTVNVTYASTSKGGEARIDIKLTKEPATP